MTSAPPLTCTTGNLVATRDVRDVSAVFRVAPKSYRAESSGKKWDLIDGLRDYVKKAGADIQIMRVSRRWSAEEFADGLRENMPQRARPDLWREHIETQHKALSELSPWTPAVFLSVRLAEPSADIAGYVTKVLESSVPEAKEAYRSWRARLRERGQNLLGKIDMDTYAPRLETAEDRVKSCLDARRATEDELQWLIKRGFYRGFGEPEIVPSGVFSSPMENRIRSMEWWLDRVPVTRHNGYLTFEPEPGTTIYQAGLCLCELKDAQRFTRDSELLFTPLEEFPWPIDASMNFRWIRPTEAQKKAETQSGRKASELVDADETVLGANRKEAQKAAYARDLFDQLLEEGDEPLLWGTISLMVYADSLPELNERLRAMEERLPHVWQRPTADQIHLWIQTSMPGQRALTVGYERPYTVDNVAAMVPHASAEAGSSSINADYVAKTLGRRPQPILVDLAEGSGTDTSTVVLLVGSPGGGKSLSLENFLYNGIKRGARCVDVDPKGDHRLHLHPNVAPYAREIVIGAALEHAGKLDPLRVAPRDERVDAATTFLVDLQHHPDDLIRAAIRGAVGQEIREHHEHACCMEVVRRLEQGARENEKRAGYVLRQSCEAGLPHLGFAQLDDPLPVLDAEQMTYLNVRALKSAHIHSIQSEMTESQRHSAALLQLVALYAMRILGDERDRLKILAFDEASFITEHAIGRQLLDQLARWGRSELAVPIISTQNVADVTDYENLVGHTFLFGMKSQDDAQRALAAMGLDPEGPLLRSLMKYHEGQCLYRDLQHRCEEIKIYVPEDLRQFLNTRPKAAETKPRMRVA